MASDVVAGLHKNGIENINGIEKAVVQFTKVEDCTTFIAHFAIKEGDLVFQFFLTPEMDEEPKDGPVAVYWMREFPTVLNRVAQEYFRATSPRLRVKYTEELQSWWFLAQGFGDNLDPERLSLKFLDKLDSALDEVQALVG